jgi:hypothetical protein
MACQCNSGIKDEHIDKLCVSAELGNSPKYESMGRGDLSRN